MLYRFIQRVLPRHRIEQLRRIKRTLERGLLRGVTQHRLASKLFYALSSTAFDREQQGVLHGRLRYLEGLAVPSGESQFLLRRNVHRLEKGLLMRPRRRAFATAYIEETVDAYLRGVAGTRTGSLARPDPELAWARDVLEHYFEVTGDAPAIKRARAKFRERPALPKNGEAPDAEKRLLVPYTRDVEAPSPVSYDAFYALSRRRRSVRWFLRKEVPRPLIDEAVRAAAQAPSACNRQPFVFRVFDDPELVEQVLELPVGVKGYAHNVPTVVVVVGRLRAYFSERDRHVIYIDGALAAMSFMYALETLGLSSCPINWPDIEAHERGMAQLLGLEPDERPIMLMAVGYPDPDGMVAFSQKRGLDEIRQYN